MTRERLCFVNLHPFDHGDDRIARAIGDLFLACANGSPHRFQSLSTRIQYELKTNFDILERPQ